MGLHRVLGPGINPFERYEHWTCLKCGVEKNKTDFIQCHRGKIINDILKRALATLCCSEQIVELIVKKIQQPADQSPPSETTNGDNNSRTLIVEDIFDSYSKKTLEEFLDEDEYQASIQLRVTAEKKKTPLAGLSSESIIALMNIFKPLLTDSEITLYHPCTRICLACYQRMRQEKYNGSEKIPEISCPICKNIMS
ncbi:MAG: hypothetical protein Q7T50_05800 [Candidatus Magasanikbacteria bacterium]|nr:hypothetical protein [Candidatus Magasanikbacteria bacterium]